MIETAPSQTLRFGMFEVDLRAGELRKGGSKVKLQDRPFQVLTLLLEHAGEMVSREDVRQRLWSTDTFVDFDHSIGSAVTKLRQALGDSAQNPRFVETIGSRGYRFIAPVAEVIQTSEVAAPVAPVVPGPSQERPKQLYNRRRWIMGTAILLIAATGIVLGFNVGGTREWLEQRRNPPIKSLAVLPLQNLSGDPAQEFFADGMTDELITNLAQLGNLQVISRTSVMAYKGTTKPLSQIAHELNVDAVVEGSIVSSLQRVRITAQLLDARRDRHLWARSYERDVGDVLILQSQISSAIADEIQVKLTPEQQQNLAKVAQADPEVEENYLKGRYHLNKGTEAEIQKAIGYFQLALGKDPRDAHSYVGLADSYMALDEFYEAPWDTMPKAREATLKAVELDESLAEAHASLGAVRYLYDWDWMGAEKEFKRAIELNPGSPDARIWYAQFLSEMGRNEQAIVEIKRAEVLDPLSLAVHVKAGWVFYLARKEDEAVAEWGKALDLEPGFAVVHGSIWAAYLKNSEFPKVVAALPKEGFGDESTLNLAALAGSYAAAGKRSEAERALAKLNSISKTRYVCPYEMGTAHAMLGDTDQAVGWLRKAYRMRSSCMTVMKTDPRLDALRADSRFQELLRALRFPQ